MPAQSTGRPRIVTDDQLLATIRDLVEAGVGLCGHGAVRPPRIAQEVAIAEETVVKHCNRLVNEGRLDRTTGIDPDTMTIRRGYLPSEDDDDLLV